MVDFTVKLGEQHRTRTGVATNEHRPSDDPPRVSRKVAAMDNHSIPTFVSNNDRTHTSVFGIGFALDPETGAALVPLRGVSLKGYFALVDVGDLPRVARYQWSVRKALNAVHREILYARARIDGKEVTLHRFIMGVTDRKVLVDHENHDGLDCRRQNLRFATHRQNMQNARPHAHCSSRYKGVSWDKLQNKWRAQIRHEGRTYIRLYDSEIEAAEAYDDAAFELRGEFAYRNFPDRRPNNTGDHSPRSQSDR